MNAPNSFLSIVLASMRVWAGNPRRTVGDLRDLSESIRAHGIVEPLLVRPVVGDPVVTHEVIAGQRRFLASGLAGLVEVPCYVRELTDDVALELGLIENSQREDPAPLEEAEAIERLVNDHGRTVEQIAEKLGRTEVWVRRRLSLVTLGDVAKQWLRDGKLPIKHAQQLATIDAELQAQLLARFEARGRELPTSREFVREIAMMLQRIESAPFDVRDATLAGGPCARCPKRSDAQVDLFDNPTDGARCLDTACWSAKVEVSWERAVALAKRRKLPVLEGAAVLSDWGQPEVNVRWDAPYVIKPPSDVAKPVALVRSKNGRAIELYEKPAPALTVATGGDEGDDGNDGATAFAARQQAQQREREARLARERERVGRLATITETPRGLELCARVALGAVVGANGLSDLREALAALSCPVAHLSSEREHLEAVPAGDLLRALVITVASVWANEEGDDDKAPWEGELRALVDGPKPVRVWIDEAAWDGLSQQVRDALSEPAHLVVVAWQGTAGFVYADVDPATAEFVRGVCLEEHGITVHEGPEAPARPKAKRATKKGGG
jgi:ParB/RepB/Spo0J family partition protein